MQKPPPSRARARVLALVALTALLVPVLAGTASARTALADGRKIIDAQPKIVGGSQAAPHAWPAQVALLDNRISGSSAVKSQYCAGTVVNRSWILTAASCVYYEDGSRVAASTIDVWVGSQSLTGGGTRLHLAEIRVLPGWSPKTFDHNLAMLRLASPTSAPVQAITAQGVAAPDGAAMVVTGWGTTAEGTPSTVTELRQANVIKLPDSICSDGYGAQFHPLSEICVSGHGQDTCSGDSGGAVVTRRGGAWVQVGIGRISDGCGKNPATYTRLEAFSNWVKQQINPNTTSVSAKLSATRVPVGATVNVSGVVKPARGTAQVKLQRFAGGTWSDRAAGNVDQTSGAYKIAFRASAAGIYTLRIRTSTGAASTTVYLRVG